MDKKTKFKKTIIGLIPKEWEVKKLEDEIKLVYGKSLPKRNRIFGKYLVFGSNGVIDYHQKYLVKAPGIIIGRKGSIGKIFLSKTNFFPIDTTYYIILKRKGDMIFWYYFLKTCSLNKMNSHAAVPGLNRKEVYKLKKAIPPLQEQKAIAKILSDLDSKIEILEKQNEVLEKIGQAIFKHWFVDFEFPDENGKPYKSSGGKMIYNKEVGKEIPVDWKVGFLGDNILTRIIKTGITKFNNEKIYLDTASVHHSKIIDYSTKITFKEKPSRANMQPLPKSIWFAKMKNSRKVLLITEKDFFILNNIILSTGFVGLKILKEAEYYIWNIILSDRFDKIKNMLCSGTTMQAINIKNVKKIKYLIPKDKQISYFNILISKNYLKISENQNQIQTLSKIRNLLLPKLMTGKIRVKI